ncbi:MAG: Bug family tripartite tricarboxylate transporter substrate binding protein, partial [Egibacteraceae bacterium]
HILGWSRARLAGPASLLTVLLLATACGGGGGAEEAAEGGAGAETATGGPAASFEGETIRFIVSFGTGGGYDLIARTIAPFLEEELGATVVVENEDGAGGLVAANQVFTAEPDGLTIGFFSGQGIAGASIGEAEGVQFDLLEFSYVARLAADPRVLSVGAQTEYETIDDVRAAEIFRFASSGPGGSEHIDATVLFPVLGIDGEIITGYEGSAETELAVTSGDTDATSGTLSTRLPPISGGDHRGVLIIGEERVDELPDVPALLELDLDSEDMALAEAHTALQDMGRMVWSPPGVPADRLAALEQGFKAASENPDFLEEMEKAGQPLDFLSGEEAKQVAQSVLDAPDQYASLLQRAFQGQ